jgi:glycerol-3-phosphate dehydrogenase
VVGTTDTPLDSTPLEPRPREDEVAFLLETVAPYLSPAPQAADIRAIFAGIRPLVRARRRGDRGDSRNTAKLARDHVIRVSDSGLVSIMGGKWTTYRRMAEDCVDRAIQVGSLERAECSTESMRVHGGDGDGGAGPLAPYGSDAPAIARLVAESSALGERLDERLPFLAAQAVWAARQEMARTVEDVLARRIRALFLNADAAVEAAPKVAVLLAAELGRDAAWQAEQLTSFREVAERHRWHG